MRHPEKILVRIEKRGGERHPKTIILFSSFSEFFLGATKKRENERVYGEGEKKENKIGRECGGKKVKE